MTKKNIKIKRSKSRLYKKKKSSARKVFEIILLVVIAGGLGFLGYAAAGPLISYIRENSGESSATTPWEPPESTTPEPLDTSDSSDSEGDTTTLPVSDSSGSYLLPISALANPSALSQALKSAENAGCTSIIVQVKDEEGHLLYSSQLEGVKDTDVVTGTMPASQIVSMIKSSGFTEVNAIVPTLYDRITCLYVDDMCYRFRGDGYQWLDAAADKGGKRWADPFRDGTKDYYSRLAKELTAAGFNKVLMSEMRFPGFTDYDATILDARNFTDTRYTALTALYNTVNSAAGANKAAVAINIKDVLAGYGKSYGDTAEILKDRSFTGTVYLMINLADFGTTLATGEETKIPLSADPAQKAKTLVSKAAEYMGTNVTVIPVIAPTGLSAEALGLCYSAIDS